MDLPKWQDRNSVLNPQRTKRFTLFVVFLFVSVAIIFSLRQYPDSFNKLQWSSTPETVKTNTSVQQITEAYIHNSNQTISSTSPKKPARIIKVTAAYGKGAIIQDEKTKAAVTTRERILQTHIDHANRNGHIQFVQRSDIMGNIMTKIGTVLKVLMDEMAKPEEERSEWIWAHDADMVIMNRMLSLEAFLPPKGKDYNLLVTYDGNGLNIGSFFIKINTWSVYLLSAVLASPQLGQATGSLYPDQDVMGQLIKHNKYFKDKSVEIPLRWVNAYPETWSSNAFRKGDLLVHCIWISKKDLPYYLDKSESLNPDLNTLPSLSGLETNITKFWHGSLPLEQLS
ncbi:uncharacterized protein FA14DRAFT_192993 [Meira miltonrushii]|uniref:Glycosyltransferase family 34 protein n=1 Tax=Meira miltonrushii TaxID=1280837 RepID=A0A316V1F6_9BASI|nr:uncharacterized protein FA14DRAFT_192993 [Meira miltonrushii]PWN31387.1 hypothetical protein FA14DRAFT_192993 [Meira miltonrushii]